MSGERKMHYCFFCGEEIGVSYYSHPLDTCGKSECDREAAAQRQAERQEAHDRLDWDMGP